METIGLILCLAHSKCSVNANYYEINIYNCHNIMSKSKRISYAFLTYFLATIGEIMKHTKIKDHNYQNE